MPCYYPLRAFRCQNGDVVFSELARNGGGDALWLSCGQCIGCRLERSKQWAVRCVHESKLWDRNCFVTLTYSPECMPADMSLVYRDFQLFMKRLRKSMDGKVRFFMAGEYGSATRRPHYHACLFNCFFDDRKIFKSGEVKLYTSAVLDRIWGLGMCTLGDVTFESAAYCARYICEKITGDAAMRHYDGRVPEFAHMSLKPGIGAGWYQRYFKDFADGRCVSRGKVMNAPKYYMRRLRHYDPEAFEAVELEHYRMAQRTVLDRTVERLAVREIVATAGVDFSRRTL